MKVTGSSTGSQPADDDPVLSRVSRAAVFFLASGAYQSGVSAEGVRNLFAECERAGFGLSPQFEARVLAEMAALRARASRPRLLQPADSGDGAR
jgi:hypothetical protein